MTSWRSLSALTISSADLFTSRGVRGPGRGTTRRHNMRPRAGCGRHRTVLSEEHDPGGLCDLSLFVIPRSRVSLTRCTTPIAFRSHVHCPGTFSRDPPRIREKEGTVQFGVIPRLSKDNEWFTILPPTMAYTSIPMTPATRPNAT